MLKKLLNLPEQITYRRLVELCDYYSAKVYTKVRLADVLGIENSGIGKELYEFALQSHFDFVVVDDGQMPLFAVEFDGPQHDDPIQCDRDRKKNELSSRFCIPLLRIRASDLRRSSSRLDQLSERAEGWFIAREKEREANAANDSGTDDPLSRVIDMRNKPSCPLCGEDMVQRTGKYGPFLGCSQYPTCRGTVDLPVPPGHPRSEESNSKDSRSLFEKNRLAIICAGAALLVLILVVFLATRGKDEPSKQGAPVANDAKGPEAKLQALQPIAKPDSNPVKEKKSTSPGDPPTGAQMNFLAALVRRKNWDDSERDSQVEKVLGYKRAYADLSKQEVSRLLSAWDDRKK